MGRNIVQTSDTLDEQEAKLKQGWACMVAFVYRVHDDVLPGNQVPQHQKGSTLRKSQKPRDVGNRGIEPVFDKEFQYIEEARVAPTSKLRGIQSRSSVQHFESQFKFRAL